MTAAVAVGGAGLDRIISLWSLELVEAGVRRECIEDLPGIGQIDAQIADTGVTERREVTVDDPVRAVKLFV